MTENFETRGTKGTLKGFAVEPDRADLPLDGQKGYVHRETGGIVGGGMAGSGNEHRFRLPVHRKRNRVVVGPRIVQTVMLDGGPGEESGTRKTEGTEPVCHLRPCS